MSCVAVGKLFATLLTWAELYGHSNNDERS